MNKKVIRNFSMTALMLGAMFFITNAKAQAQSTCNAGSPEYMYCSNQMQTCMNEGGWTVQSTCMAQLDACLAAIGCNY